jgi:hypothetical protein
LTTSQGESCVAELNRTKGGNAAVRQHTGLHYLQQPTTHELARDKAEQEEDDDEQERGVPVEPRLSKRSFVRLHGSHLTTSNKTGPDAVSSDGGCCCAGPCHGDSVGDEEHRDQRTQAQTEQG